MLSDKEKRQIYDRSGEEGLKQSGGFSDPFDSFSRFVFHFLRFVYVVSFYSLIVKRLLLCCNCVAETECILLHRNRYIAFAVLHNN